MASNEKARWLNRGIDDSTDFGKREEHPQARNLNEVEQPLCSYTSKGVRSVSCALFLFVFTYPQLDGGGDIASRVGLGLFWQLDVVQFVSLATFDDFDFVIHNALPN